MTKKKRELYYIFLNFLNKVKYSNINIIKSDSYNVKKNVKKMLIEVKNKQTYNNMDYLKQFRIDELERFKAEHPNIPYPESFFRSKSKYDDKTSNGLTQLVIRYIIFVGGQAERISTTGRMIDRSKVVTDVLGYKRKIGTAEWIPGTGTKGSADVSSIIRSKRGTVIPWKIEIKIKDKQSDDQKKYEQDVINSGGQYSIVHSFEEFYKKYTILVETI